MWPRVVELMLGMWLAASPFFLIPQVSWDFELANVFFCATVIVTASCLAYWEPTRHARAATAIIALWLAGRSYIVASFPAEPMHQNEFLIGLLLLMFAIVPNEAGQPPISWRPYVRKPQETGGRADTRAV